MLTPWKESCDQPRQHINSIETCILSIVKQITSPGWMHEISARAWCTGKTQRDWVEREVGGGSGWEIHVNPWLIHVNVWQNPLKYCKVISLQLTKIHEEKKSRDITLSTKVSLVNAMVFPVVMYRCESWTIKKAEHWRIDAFELWCWRRLLRVPWAARRSNQSILKEISPGCSLMLKLKTPILWPPHAKSWLIEKDPDAWEGLGPGGEGDDRGWDGWTASLTQWTWV